MATTKRLKVEVQAEVKGQEAVLKLQREMDQLGKEAKFVDREIDKANKTLGLIPSDRATAAIGRIENAFKTLSTSGKKSAAEIETAYEAALRQIQKVGGAAAAAQFATAQGRTIAATAGGGGTPDIDTGGVSRGTALLGGLAAAAAVATTAVIALGAGFRALEGVAELQDIADKTGETAERLGELKYAADLSGTSMQQVGAASVKLTAQLSKNPEELRGALSAIGITLEDFQKLKPADQMQAIATALDGFEDGAGKTAVAVALLGKSGAEMLPFLKDLAEVGPRAYLSGKQIEDIDTFTKSVTQLGYALQHDLVKVLADFVPMMQEVLNQITNADSEFRVFWKGIVDGVQPVTDVIVDFATRVYAVIADLVSFLAGSGDVGSFFKELGLIIAGVASVISEVLIGTITNLVNWFQQIIGTIGVIVGQFGDASSGSNILADALRFVADMAKAGAQKFGSFVQVIIEYTGKTIITAIEVIKALGAAIMFVVEAVSDPFNISSSWDKMNTKLAEIGKTAAAARAQIASVGNQSAQVVTEGQFRGRAPAGKDAIYGSDGAPKKGSLNGFANGGGENGKTGKGSTGKGGGSGKEVVDLFTEIDALAKQEVLQLQRTSDEFKRIYDKNLVDLRTYYGEQENIIRRQGEVEKAAYDARRAALVGELNSVKTDEARKKLKEEISKLDQAYADKAYANGVKLAQLEDTKTKALREQALEYEKLNLKLLETIGLGTTEEANTARAAIVTEQYRVVLEKLNVEREAALVLAAQGDVAAAQHAARLETTIARTNQLRQIEISRQAEAARQVTLENDLTGNKLEQLKIQGQLDAGLITGGQAQNQLNELKQVEFDKRRAVLEVTLKQQEADGNQTGANATRVKIQELDNQLLKLKDNTVSASTIIRRNLESSLGDTLTNILTKTVSFKDGMKQLFKQIALDILKSGISQSISKVFKGMDSKGGGGSNDILVSLGKSIAGLFTGGGGGGSSGGGDFLSSLFGMFTGGGGGGGGGGSNDFLGTLIKMGMSFFGFANGGAIRGPGTGTSDSIPALVSNGEYVVKASSVKKFGVGFMDAINNGILPAFRAGGGVNFSAPSVGIRQRFAEGGLVESGNGMSGMMGMKIVVENTGAPKEVDSVSQQETPEGMVTKVMMRDISVNGPITRSMAGAVQRRAI